jgi:glycerophosphoryl diester phosphodiesterase
VRAAVLRVPRHVVAGCLLLLCGVCVSCARSDPPRRDAFDAQGHRGARGLLPENTLPAFRRAIELGVSTLELDVGVSRDGVVVVMHDPAVPADRCLGADGVRIAGEQGPLLRDLPWDSLRRFDCGSLNPDPRRLPEPPWESRPGEPMPSLDQVFELARLDPGLRFNVETKLRPGDADTVAADAFVDAVLDSVRRHGLAPRVSIQSFDWRALSRVKRRAPGIRTVGLVSPRNLAPEWLDGLVPDPRDPMALFRRARGFVDQVSPHWRMLLPEGGPVLSLAALQAEGFAVVPWTVNEPEAMRRLVRLGVDGLISDYPDLLLRVLREESVPVR